MLKPLTTALFLGLTLVPVTYVYSSDVNSPPTDNPVKTVAPFKAQYQVFRRGSSVGKAIRQLSMLENGQAEYSYNTDLKLFIFSDKRSETSVINWQGYQVIPSQYTYKREGTGKDKFYQWQYDVEAGQATDVRKKKSYQLDFPENVQDKLSYHFKHRLTMLNEPEKQSYSYPVVTTSGTVKDYQYQYDGKETIELPYGSLETIRLKRAVKNKDRVTYAWFAPELDYLLVKLRQLKDGSEQFEARLESYQLEQ